MASDSRTPKWLRSAFRDAFMYCVVTTCLMYWLEPVQHYFPHQVSHTAVAEMCGIYLVGIPLIAGLMVALFDALPTWRRARRARRKGPS